MHELSEGHDAHMPAAARLVFEGWNEVNKDTACRYWIKDEVLPCSINEDIVATYGKTQNNSNSLDVNALVQMFQRMNLSMYRRGLLHHHDQEVDDLENRGTVVADIDSSRPEPLEDPLPLRSEAMRLLDRLENIACDSQVNDSVIHLRRVCSLFCGAFRNEAQSAIRQHFINEVVQRT